MTKEFRCICGCGHTLEVTVNGFNVCLTTIRDARVARTLLNKNELETKLHTGVELSVNDVHELLTIIKRG